MKKKVEYCDWCDNLIEDCNCGEDIDFIYKKEKELE
jgi:hypothetical protein